MDFDVGAADRGHDEGDEGSHPASPTREPAETVALNGAADYTTSNDDYYPSKPQDSHVRRKVSILCYVTIAILILLIGLVIVVYFVKKTEVEKAASGGKVAGVTSSSTNGENFIKPEVRMTPERLAINKKEELLLTCHLMSGHPEPDFIWTHNGTTVDTDAEGRGLIIMTYNKSHYKSRLKILVAQESDSGMFKCTAQNAAGEGSAQANVSVAVLSHSMECDDEHDSYCFNGGTCLIFGQVGESSMHCKCPSEFTGPQCERRDISEFTSFLPSQESTSPDKSPYMATIGVLLLVLSISIIVKCVYSYNYKKKQSRRSTKQQMLENGNRQDHPNANGDVFEKRALTIT